MTDQVLDVLKIGLLCLLYLFFVRVLWTVWTEVRTAAPVASGSQVASPRTPVPAATRPAQVATPVPVEVVPTRLTVIEPSDLYGTTYQIGHSLPIGRDAETGVKISGDNFVSGKHARVSLIAGAVYVDDVGSRNGTYLNGVRISEQSQVHAGDRIQIGYTVLEAG